MTIRATVTDVDDTAGGTAIDLIAPSQGLPGGSGGQYDYEIRRLVVRGDPVCIGGDSSALEFIDGATGASPSEAGKEGHYLADGDTLELPYSAGPLYAITAAAGTSTIHVLAPYGPDPA